MVRFIDNFSAGTRGATSAEYLLSEGYAVIFLHRQYSLLPYSRHYSHSTNCFLDYMTRDSSSRSGNSHGYGGSHDQGVVQVSAEYQDQMGRVLGEYEGARKANTLLLIPFTSVNDYLWELRSIALLMRPLAARGLFYLAAAVSDFFIPAERMVVHKIQSGGEEEGKGGDDISITSTTAGAAGGSMANGSKSAEEGERPPAARIEGKRLIVDLDPVPKFLKALVDGWAPEGMIVSFKLETDPSILVQKAKGALKKYAHHLVIGNLLSTRKWEVVFVSQNEDGVQWIRVPRGKRTRSMSGIPTHVGLASGNGEGDTVAEDQPDSEIPEGDPPIEIESMIIPEVAALHSSHIKSIQG